VATSEVDEDIDGEPPGVLPGAPTAATTEVDKDVNGRPSRRCCWEL
jgi:hypothetical protein